MQFSIWGVFSSRFSSSIKIIIISMQKIIGSNTLRFTCFLLIFLNHAGQLFPYSYLAVEFFFSLSAFLLTLPAYEEIKKTGTFSQKNFFMRRTFRIWPLYFVFLFIGFLIVPAILHQVGMTITLPRQKIYYLLFISNFYFEPHHFAFQQLWSISVQEQFYLVFLILSFLLKRHTWILVAALSLVSIGTIQYSIWFPMNTHANTFYHLISFGTGIAAAKLASGKSFSIKITLAGILISFLISALFINNPQLNSYRKIPFSVFTGLVILLIYQAQPFFKKAKPFFVIPEQLGKYSYGFYVFSGFVISVFGHLSFTNNLFLKISAELVTIFIIAATSYYLIELPFIKLKDKFRNY